MPTNKNTQNDAKNLTTLNNKLLLMTQTLKNVYMKKNSFICKILTFLLFSSLIIPSSIQTAHAFIDVPSDYIYSDEIEGLYKRKIVNGYSDFSFHPHAYISRVEALSMILRARGDSVRRIDDVNFSDVFASDWYYNIVNYASNQRIINGHPDGTFHPQDSINMAEAVKIVMTAFYPGIQPKDFRPDPLIYSQYSDWYASYFSVAKSKNIISSKKFYYPKDLITRGELASMIYRIMLIQENKEVFIPPLDNKVNNDFFMYIPKLGIENVPIVTIHNLKSRSELVDRLIDGVGNILKQPGSSGNVILYGHSSFYPGVSHPYKHIFRQIDKLTTGDRIYINYGNRAYVYEVTEETIVSPKQIDILNSRGHEELTLFTCWPPDTIRYRYVVSAKPIIIQ